MKRTIIAFTLILLPLFMAMGQTKQKLTPTSTMAVTDSLSIFQDSVLSTLQKIHNIQYNTSQQKKSSEEQAKQEHDRNNKSVSEIDGIYGIVDNTEPDFWKNGWNLIAILGLLIAFITFWAQWSTEKHTQNAPKSVQIGVLKDLPRHFYRNLVCTCAILFKFRQKRNVDSSGKRMAYPSEANMLKLTTLPDEFILPIDSTDDKIYRKMHEEKLLFRNYNMEIDVASKHFAINGLKDDSLKNDYDNLLFKPFYLVSRMYELQDLLSDSSQSEMNVPYSLYAFVKEHFEKIDFSILIDNKNGELDNLNSIWDNEKFVEAIGVKKDSITRALEKILKHKKDNTAFLIKEDGKDEVVIDRDLFKDSFEKMYDEEEKNGNHDGLKKFQNIFEIKDKDQYRALFANKLPNELSALPENVLSQKIEDSYIALKRYFNFFQKEKWQINDLIFNIIKVDAVLEMSKIGMIEYR